MPLMELQVLENIMFEIKFYSISLGNHLYPPTHTYTYIYIYICTRTSGFNWFNMFFVLAICVLYIPSSHSISHEFLPGLCKYLEHVLKFTEAPARELRDDRGFSSFLRSLMMGYKKDHFVGHLWGYNWNMIYL